MILPLFAAALAAHPSLDRAHRAWLDDDTHTLVAEVGAVLADGDALERRNALELLDVAWRAHDAWLPGPWAPPTGVRRVAVDQIRIEGPTTPRYQLTLRAWADDCGVVADLQLRGPGVDLQRASGRWSVTPEGDRCYVEVEGPEGPTPAVAGAYRLGIVTADAVGGGWVPLFDHVATTSPVVAEPRHGEVVHGEMTVRWDPTPRSVGVWIADADTGAEAWSTWLDAGTSGVVTAELPDGTYGLVVSHRDVRSLGRLQIGRVARSARQVHVRRER
jgi:hypothetical protein